MIYTQLEMPDTLLEYEYNRYILSTKGVLGITKTESLVNIQSNTIMYRYYFDTEENKKNWEDYLPEDIRSFITK